MMFYATSQEQQEVDFWASERREFAEQAAANERASRQNVEVFTRMFLTLGADAVKLAGGGHDMELGEAKDRAAARWSHLLDLEAQVVREEANLAVRPSKRPPQPGDDLLADEVLKRQAEAFAAQTAGRRDQVAVLKAQAKAERAELESFIVRRK
jgi:hypothetical protein